MKPGSKAKLKQPVVAGTIVDTEYDKEANCLRHCLEWVDDSNGDGVPETHRRWFLETDLEEVQ
jgi:hypothetical protein